MRILLTFLTVVTVLTFGTCLASAGVFVSTDKVQRDRSVAPAKAPAAPAGALDCSGAIEVSLNNVYYGSNTGAPNNVTAYSCQPDWYEAGGEVVYHLYLPDPADVQATVTGSTCDLDLAVLSSCDEDLGCVALVDNGFYTSAPISGDYYFVGDGFYGDECDFTLEIYGTVTPPPPPPPYLTCDSATVLVCDDAVLEGTTCDGINFTTFEGTCDSWEHAGLEAWYQITLGAGGSFTATVTPLQVDAMLLVVDGCEPLNCLAYADNGLTFDPETITYTNNTAGVKTVYLVIDSYLADSCGWYDLELSCTGGPVSVETKTWGAIKSLYR